LKRTVGIWLEKREATVSSSIGQNRAGNGSGESWRGVGARDTQQRVEAGGPEEEEMSRYLIVIEKAGVNFSAYSPDVPGCVSTGSTVEETKRNMEEAIEFHLEGMRQDGLPVPMPSSVAEYVEVP
jgi:predicted RNase H-like HicB family nuclease